MQEQIQRHHRNECQRQQTHPGSVAFAKFFGPLAGFCVAEFYKTPGEEVDVNGKEEKQNFEDQSGISHKVYGLRVNDGAVRGVNIA